MNKLTKTFFTAFIMAATLTIVSMLAVGCKSTSEPDENQAYDSEAAADITAASLGNESGGAGVNFADVSTLIDKGAISSEIVSKGGTPKSIDSSYNDATGEHTLTITRSIDWGQFNFDATIVYKYTFFDAAGQFSRFYQKGTTNKITISVSKQRSLDKGERLDADDAASGSWIIDNIVSGTPILNGTYTRDGSVTFHSPNNKDRHLSFTLSFNFTNDTIVKSDDGKHTYLKGTATSDFSATTDKYEFTRHTDITFDGEGMANLIITRTSGDGNTETHEVDVKVGRWIRKVVK
jgi:hypothetical protein